jgi:putative ABC transport system permease protein
MIKPPKILESILQFIVDYDERESLCGDFAETYTHIINASGKARALYWYLFQISKLIPVFVFESLTWSLAMFLNYFKVALRNLLNQKSYSFINISGLALGIATCLIIFLYLRAELSYDDFNEHADRIFLNLSILYVCIIDRQE